jgi:hypothetical protein
MSNLIINSKPFLEFEADDMSKYTIPKEIEDIQLNGKDIYNLENDGMIVYSVFSD